MEILNYLTPEEEAAIKANIPWERLDENVRDLVLFANQTSGIATLQSCAGHITPALDGELRLSIDPANIAFRATKERLRQIVFEIGPVLGIDVNIRYFDDATFWVCFDDIDPSNHEVLRAAFRALQARAPMVENAADMTGDAGTGGEGER
jgi:hypothetical protein